jgi:quinol monooxygenase YgiN
MFMKSIKATTLATVLIGGTMTTSVMAGGHLDATDDISWTLTLELADGQDDTFDALMAEMVVATKEEAGAKGYEWHRSGNTIHINERYESNADAGVHLGNFGENFAERFLAILTPTGLQVYGPAEGGTKEGLAGFGATFYDQVGGFER